MKIKLGIFSLLLIFLIFLKAYSRSPLPQIPLPPMPPAIPGIPSIPSIVGENDVYFGRGPILSTTNKHEDGFYYSYTKSEIEKLMKKLYVEYSPHVIGGDISNVHMKFNLDFKHDKFKELLSDSSFYSFALRNYVLEGRKIFLQDDMTNPIYQDAYKYLNPIYYDLKVVSLDGSKEKYIAKNAYAGGIGVLNKNIVIENNVDLTGFPPGRYCFRAYLRRNIYNTSTKKFDIPVKLLLFDKELIIGGSVIKLPDFVFNIDNSASPFASERKDKKNIYEKTSKFYLSTINKTTDKKIVVFEGENGISPEIIKCQWLIKTKAGALIYEGAIETLTVSSILTKGNILIDQYISDSSVISDLKEGTYKAILRFKYAPAGTELVKKEKVVDIIKEFKVIRHGAVNMGIVDPQISLVSFDSKDTFLKEDTSITDNDLELLLTVVYAWENPDKTRSLVSYFDGVFPEKYIAIDSKGKKRILTSYISYRLVCQNTENNNVKYQTDWKKVEPKNFIGKPVESKDGISGRVVQYQLKVPNLKILNPGEYEIYFEVRYERGKWKRLGNDKYVLQKVKNGNSTWFNTKRKLRVKVKDITPPVITYYPPVITDMDGNKVLPCSGDELEIKAKIEDYKMDEGEVTLYLESFPYSGKVDKNLEAVINQKDKYCKRISMEKETGNIYVARFKVPINFASKSGKHWEYFIEAVDNEGNVNMGDKDIKDNNQPDKKYGANGVDIQEIVVNDNDPPNVTISVSDFEKIVNYNIEIYGGEAGDNLVNHQNAPIQVKINGKLFDNQPDLIKNPVKNLGDKSISSLGEPVDIEALSRLKGVLIEGKRVLIKVKGRDAVDGKNVKFDISGLPLKEGANYFIPGRVGDRYDAYIKVYDGVPNKDGSISVRVIKIPFKVLPNKINVQTIYSQKR